jgi:predicted nucleic acid-binding protein
LRATFEHMIFNVEFWTAVMAGQIHARAARAGGSPAGRDRQANPIVRRSG